MRKPVSVSLILFNPFATSHNPRIPNSVLQVAAAIDGKYEWVIVDGNKEKDPWTKIRQYLKTGDYKFFGCTVMPGPQLRQAIPIAKKVREEFPDVKIIWGGYFPSNHPRPVLFSGYVDVIVNGMGDKCFPMLLDALQSNSALDEIPNLIFRKGDQVVTTRKEEILDQENFPDLPYEKLNQFYPMSRYLVRTYLGSKTIAYHSSHGCPFTCSFCAVVPIYNARWKGQSAEKIYRNVKRVKQLYGGNAVEFHDNNFFVSEKRTVEFAQLVKPDNMIWWGEGRIDTIDKYKDESLKVMRDSGCKMIFFGAETGSDALLQKMDKGGTQSREQIIRFAKRMKDVDIIPEYSFVLGFPADSEEEVARLIREEIQFIKEIKRANPNTEIIIYIYSPVPTENSELYNEVRKTGFRFPEKLEDWISPQWENFDLRKNPLTPWLKPYMIDQIKNFETVLNGYYPTVSDVRLKPWQKKVLRLISTWRYKMNFFSYPYEIKVLQKLWKYRQPETEGF